MERIPQMPQDPNARVLNELEREADLALEKFKMEHSDPEIAEFRAEQITRNRQALYEEHLPRLEKAIEDLEQARDNRMCLEGIRVKMSQAQAITPEWDDRYREALADIMNEVGSQVSRVTGHEREIQEENDYVKGLLDRNPHVKHVLQEEALKEDEERSKK